MSEARAAADADRVPEGDEPRTDEAAEVTEAADAAEGTRPPVPGTTTPEGGTISVEELLGLVETLTAERDANFEARARLQAEFENYRKRVAKQEQDQVARAAEALVSKLLPSLDAFDAALAHGAEGVEPLHQSLWSTLEREGLCRLAPLEEPFDPNEHEAVLHEEGEGDEPRGVVVDVLRAGYAWKGRVIRPAMVKVRT